jgi:hypothetical protein
MLSKIKILTGVFMMALLMAPRLSFADWSIGIGIGDHHDDRGHHGDDHRFYRYHDHPHFGLHLHYLPHGYFTIWVGGARYYYFDGLYYSYVGAGDYALVNPPIGAYVSVIPSDFQPVIINGRTYYMDNGVYYILTEHHGYKVVPAPVAYVQPAPVVVAQAVDIQGSFPVNIPNGNGSYTTVLIKKSGNGYVGPQGEFYAQFPSIAQLKAMYIK